MTRRRVRAAPRVRSATREDPRHGIRSFFVIGPDGVRIEIVESPPIQEAVWD